MSRISETVYIKLKTIFVNSLIRSYGEMPKLGGPGELIQVDETACNRRRLITSPTSEAEYVRGTRSVLGAISERTKEIRLQVLEDRSVESLQRFFNSNINPNSIIKSDGFRSYPAAVRNNNCTHRVINHSLVGFKKRVKYDFTSK